MEIYKVVLFSEIKEVEEGNTSDGMAGDGQVDRQLIDNFSWSLFFSPAGRSSLKIPYDWEVVTSQWLING